MLLPTVDEKPAVRIVSQLFFHKNGTFEEIDSEARDQSNGTSPKPMYTGTESDGSAGFDDTAGAAPTMETSGGSCAAPDRLDASGMRFVQGQGSVAGDGTW